MIAFSLGFILCGLIWAGAAAISADNRDAEQARREDEAYLRGWNHGQSRKSPQLHQFQ